MSGRFVRASKFRHVHAEAPKKDSMFSNIAPSAGGDSQLVAVSKSYVATGKKGGGGAIYLLRQDTPGRITGDTPDINVHKSAVTDIDFNPFNENLVATGSEDCLAKVTQIPEGGLNAEIREAAVSLEAHQKKVVFVKFNPVANNVLTTAGADNVVKVWDIETSTEKNSYDAHADLIQSVAWNRDGSRLASSGKDKVLNIWDPRNAAAAAKIDSHEGTKGSKVCWADNCNKLFVTGFSKTATRKIIAFDIRNPTEKVVDVELDQSAGTLLPFYDEDTKILFIAGKGDGKIFYYEVTEDNDGLFLLDAYASSEPQRGVGFAPKSSVDYNICEVDRAFRLLKDAIEPLQFVVPRKSDLFQSDLYPDTYAAESTVTAADWFAGTDGTVKLGEIKDVCAKKASAGAAAFTARKTYAELEKELAEAQSRIKELEDELAALKK